MAKKPHAYEGNGLTVTFDSGVCIHAGNCVRELPAVFDLEKRPWVQPANAPAEAVIAQVKACPSGALQLQASDD